MADGLNHKESIRDQVMEKMRKLAEVSKQLEQQVRAQGQALNVMQAGAIKKRVDELTERQNELVMSIVDMYPDKKKRDEFVALGNKIEDFRPKIRACNDHDELETLKKEVDQCVDDWVDRFQSIVRDLVGSKEN